MVAPEVPDVLAAPFWYALTGAHAGLGRVVTSTDGAPLAARYDEEISPFAAVADPADPVAWAALSELVGRRGRCVVMLDGTVGPAPWPEGEWRAFLDQPGVQMVGEDIEPADDPGAVRLGADDVADMLALVERTRPGPFSVRTVEFGGYLGVRVDGRLVAMAGERSRPPGYTEVSAVCTDADHRGRGLAATLVRAVAAGITSRGEVPFLHTGASNTTAIALYERLGFRVRRSVRFVGLLGR